MHNISSHYALFSGGASGQTITSSSSEAYGGRLILRGGKSKFARGSLVHIESDQSKGINILIWDSMI